MRVLRDNKESLMAVLEAFVYDPLINWRLMPTKSDTRRPPSKFYFPALPMSLFLHEDQQESRHGHPTCLASTHTHRSPSAS